MTEKGKWRRKNLRVPIECVGHLWGFSAMFSSARLTSASNFSAATGLRSKYQSSAASYSAAAALKKFSWFTDHDRAWQQSGVALHPRRWFRPYRNQAPQCAELLHRPKRLEQTPRLPLQDYRSESPQVWRARWQAALGLFSADHRL